MEKSEESDLHNLAEQADRVRHVRSKRGTEDDLSNTCFGQVLALLADNIRSTADGECCNLFLRNKSADSTKVKEDRGAGAVPLGNLLQ